MSEQVRAFLAVILSGAVIFGWQYFFSPDTSTLPVNPPTQQVRTVENGVSKTAPLSTKVAPLTQAESSVPEEKIELSASGTSYNLNNHFEIVSIQGDYAFEDLVGTKSPLQISLWKDGKDIPLTLTVIEKTAEKYVAQDSVSGVQVTFNILPDQKLSYQIQSATPQRYHLTFKGQSGQSKSGKAREFLLHSDSVDRIEMKKEDKGEKLIQWFGVDFDYHLFAVTFSQKQSVNYALHLFNQESEQHQTYTVDVTTNTPVQTLAGHFVLTKKNYDELLALGDNLHMAVDFGWFGILAVPFLRCLQFFYKYFPNYGIGIILLTLVLRLLTFPLQYKSFRGMKKMQEMQPEMARLRERFKDEPQRLNQETMSLFKRAGYNPLSGCLPILLQLPIFIALYRMLYSAVELVGAPFYGWIVDLSVKDPYYVLPLLMTASMFAQQKMTPTANMDPAQAKVMLFMPLIFGFIMKDFPAGLNLYIFVSTVFGILQQLLVYRMMGKN